MTDHELERRLRTALDHAAPNDLEGVLSRCEAGKGTVIDMTNELQPKKKRNRWAPLAIAACLALVLVGGGGGYYYYSANAVASLVSLDVNPSIQLEVNKNEKVLSATPMNDDGAEILDGMDLKGTPADVAMYAIIGSLLQHGYVDELANSILITVEDNDQTRGEKLQQELTAQADAALANAQVNGSVLAQTLQNNQELTQKAQEYGISTGKAALIQAIVLGSNNTKTFEELVGLSINELNLLYTAQGFSPANPDEIGVIGSGDTSTYIVTEGPPIVVSGSASQSGYIGLDAAKSAALSHAGVSASDATFVEAEYDYDDGRMVYEVEFHVKGIEYDYEIDAQTGAVVKYKSEQNGTNTGSSGSASANTGSYIGESAAKSAALTYAGVKESDTTYCNAWLEYDDGRAECYEVEFMVGSTRYECKVALTSATVIECEQENYGGSTASNQSSGQSGGASASSTDIGAEKAKSIALSHAGVSASQASQLKAERDMDDGVLEYEVEFKAGGIEYEYTIHGGTGQILKYESDRD